VIEKVYQQAQPVELVERFFRSIAETLSVTAAGFAARGVYWSDWARKSASVKVRVRKDPRLTGLGEIIAIHNRRRLWKSKVRSMADVSGK